MRKRRIKARVGRPKRPTPQLRLDTPAERRYSSAAAIVLAVGFVISAYLTYAEYRLRHDVGWCSVGPSWAWNCDRTLLASYAHVGRAPLSAFGAVFYAAPAAALVRRLLRGAPTHDAGWFFLALGAFGSVVAMFVLVFALIRSESSWIVPAFAAVNAALMGVSWRAVRRSAEPVRAPAWWLEHASLYCVVSSVLVVAAYAVRPLAASNLCDVVAAEIVRATPAHPLEAIIYSDFQCEHYRSANDALRAYRTAPMIALSFRHYPWDLACNPAGTSSQSGECAQARASICADKQGLGNAMRDALFESPPDAAELSTMARRLGIEPIAFGACMLDAATAWQLRSDIAEADRMQLRGTPMLVIGGPTFTGFSSDDRECMSGHMPQMAWGTSRSINDEP
jgi:uncharacterized membrane protein